jgi:hypothetical protein
MADGTACKKCKHLLIVGEVYDSPFPLESLRCKGVALPDIYDPYNGKLRKNNGNPWCVNINTGECAYYEEK